MASTSAEAEFNAETAIKDAQQHFDLGMDALKRDDLDAAADAFGTALDLRTRVYGELGTECASAYYRYGITLLERAQNNTGILGNKVEVVDEDEEDGDDEDGDDEDGDEDGEEGAADMDADAAAPSKDDKGKGKAVEEPPEEEDDEEEDGEEEEEEGGDEEDDPTAEKDDLQVAWEALETAKVLYQRTADTSASELADIHLRLGDVQAENGQVEEAIREYDTCIAYQDRFLPPDARPRAEVRFNKAIALSLFEKPLEALRAVQEARTILEAHIDSLKAKLSESTPEACEQINATIKDLEGVLDDFDEREDDLREQAASFEDKRKEVKDSMQMIMSVLGSMAGGEQGAQEGDPAHPLAPADGAAAGPSEVKDLGVVGRGKRRVQPVAVGSPPAAQTNTHKRSLESLMGGQTPASEGNPFANVVSSGTPVGLTGSTPLLPVVKKLKIEGDGESPGPKTGEGSTGSATPVPAFLQKENVAATYTGEGSS